MSCRRPGSGSPCAPAGRRAPCPGVTLILVCCRRVSEMNAARPLLVLVAGGRRRWPEHPQDTNDRTGAPNESEVHPRRHHRCRCAGRRWHRDRCGVVRRRRPVRRRLPGKCPMWSVWCSRFPRRTSVRRSVTRFSWVAAGLDVRGGDWNPIAETVSARSRAHPSLRRILSRVSRSLFIHSRRGALPRRRAARGWLVDIDSDLVPAPRRTRDTANLAAPTRAVSF